jgi:hypothetical protein
LFPRRRRWPTYDIFVTLTVFFFFFCLRTWCVQLFLGYSISIFFVCFVLLSQEGKDLKFSHFEAQDCFERGPLPSVHWTNFLGRSCRHVLERFSGLFLLIIDKGL